MTKTTNTSKKFKDPVHRFSICIRDRDHFVAIISTMNKSCNAGVTNWTMTKKVGKFLRRSQRQISTDILIFNTDVHPTELETFVKLL